MNDTDEMAVTGQDVLQRVAHCLYRSQLSGIYYGILKRGGRQVKRSLKTKDHALARRRLADLEEKASRLSTTDQGKVGFEELGARWLEVAGTALKPKSHARLAGVLKSLNGYFGKMLVRGVGKAHVEKWAAVRSKMVAARTFNNERGTLVRLLAYAVREGLILENPGVIVQRQKPGKQRAAIPTRNQFKILIEAIRDMKVTAHDAADLCEFLAYSGCRLGEATAMLWGDVDFESKQFKVTGGEGGTKNREVRTVPLFPALEALLLRLRESVGDAPKPSDRIMKIDNGKKALAAACRMASLPHVTHHHLRHFFCSNAIEAGVDFKTIAGWLGHKDGGLLVAQTYGHLRDEHSAAMAKRMTFGATGESEARA